MNQQQSWGPGAYQEQPRQWTSSLPGRQQTQTQWNQPQQQQQPQNTQRSTQQQPRGWNAQTYPQQQAKQTYPQQQAKQTYPQQQAVNFVSAGYNNYGNYTKPQGWAGNRQYGASSKPSFNRQGSGAGWNQGWQRRKQIKKPPREKKFYECELCKVRCDTPDQLNIHQSSKKHMKRVKAAEAAPAKPADAEGAETTAAKKKAFQPRRQKFHCELCGVWCDTQTILTIHLTSKKHLKKIKQNETGTPNRQPFKCALCNVSCSSQHALSSHLNSRKHQRNQYQVEAQKNEEEGKANADAIVAEKPKEDVKPAPKPAPAELVKKEDAVEATEATETPAKATATEPAEGTDPKEASASKKCELCRIICQNQEAYDFHIGTNRHKKREQAMTMQFKCEVCCVGTNTQLMLDNHKESKNHKLQVERQSKQKWGYQKSPHAKSEGEKKGKRKRKDRRKKKKDVLKMDEETAEDVEAGTEEASADDIANNPFVCALCDVRCNTQAVLDVHLASKRHFRKVKFTNDQKQQLFCPPCKFQATSKTDFDDHLRSQEHADTAGLTYQGDSSTGKRKGVFGEEPRKKAKIEEEEWRVCRLCGSEAHQFKTCPIKENRGWQIDPIERTQLRKCTTIANDRHRDLVVLFTVKDHSDNRLVSHFICCSGDVQRKMLHQSMKLMSDMLQFVPNTQWYEIDYRFGNWLHKPKKSAPHLHILFPEKQFLSFLREQPTDSPIWPQGLTNYEEFSLTQKAEKDYSLDRVYATKKQGWYNNFTIIDNLLLETKVGLETLLKNGVCDGSVGLRVGRLINQNMQQHYQFFIRVSAEPFIAMSEKKQNDIKLQMEEGGFELFTGEQWNIDFRV